MKKHLLVISLILTAASLTAQENGNRDANNRVIRGPYETNGLWDNWFIGVAGGVNIYRGENDSYGSFKDQLAPAIDVSVGKWFTPSVGARLQWSGIQARGWAWGQAPYATGSSDQMNKEKFNVSFLHGDLMWNISNALGGYKETRTWNFIPYISAGWARSWGNDHYKNEIAAAVGLLNTIRLSPTVDLTLEAREMFVNQRFDLTTGRRSGEGMTSLTAGISVKIGKVKSFKRVEKPDYTPYTKRIKELEGYLTRVDGQNKLLAGELEAAKNRKPDTVVVEKSLSSSSVKASPVALFFGLGKATLDKKELANLEFYVKTAMEVDKTKVFTLTGSADSATGNAATNQRLSEQRMQYVYDLLVNKYGISPERLIKKAEGASNNRFSEPELNRAVFVE